MNIRYLIFFTLPLMTLTSNCGTEIKKTEEDIILKVKTMDDYKKIVEGSKKPVLIKFYADYCPPCRMMAPIFEKVAESYKDKVTFVSIDTQNCDAGLFTKHSVRYIPRLIFYKDGKEIFSSGGMDEDKLESSIEEYLLK